MYLMVNQKYFPAERIMMVKQKLMSLDESRFMMTAAIDLKDPTAILLVSIFVGSLGIDRFLIGDIGMGVLKLLTAGCCGIFTIIDWFMISSRVREINFNKIMTML